MKFMRNHWYDIGLIPMFAAVLLLVMLWSKLEVLQRHCDRVGRDYAEIEKTALGTVHLAPGEQTAADVIAECRALAAVGIQHVIYNMPNVEQITPIEIMGRDVLPVVGEF